MSAMSLLLKRALEAVLLLAVATPALAQSAGNFPSRPIKILVGFPAAGSTDSVVRLMAQAASKSLGQPVVIENRPGAGGAISIVQMKNSPPDGYTLALLTLAVFRSPVVEDAGYDPIDDITYVIRLTNVQFGVAVLADAPWRNWQDFVAYAKTHPEKISYGVPAGLGNSAHLLMEEIAGHERSKWTAIPYKGSADLAQAFIGRHIAVSVDGSGGFGRLVDSGRARLLAMASEERSPRWKDVPTLKELGYNVAVDSPWGLGGPKGMDPRAVQVVHDAFKRSLEDAAVQNIITQFGQGIRYMGPAEYARYAVEAYKAERALLTKYGFAKKR
ncbi:MAG: tripartite tricarboxylate transporter substrate binding protein [Burkholderiales bacterium]|nr:tripartite tricarboxylate transporter substrate binding protein [Burkholderiales bacterium]